MMRKRRQNRTKLKIIGFSEVTSTISMKINNVFSFWWTFAIRKQERENPELKFLDFFLILADFNNARRKSIEK